MHHWAVAEAERGRLCQKTAGQGPAMWVAAGWSCGRHQQLRGMALIQKENTNWRCSKRA
jgi:hypothetical protein